MTEKYRPWAALWILLVLSFIIFIIKCCLRMSAEEKDKPSNSSNRRRYGGQTYQPVEMEARETNPNANPVAATPVVQPPYPVEALHPTPHAPPPAGYAHNPPYPTHAPHPVPGAAPYPPMTTPYPPAAAPYPPAGPPVGMAAPYPDYSANPPTYSEAVSQAPVRPPPNTSENYAKQSPYNPNY